MFEQKYFFLGIFLTWFLLRRKEGYYALQLKLVGCEDQCLSVYVQIGYHASMLLHALMLIPTGGDHTSMFKYKKVTMP